MKTRIQKLLAVTLLAASALHAHSSTNKTHMNYRSVGRNLARQYGTTWHRNLHRDKREDSWGSEVQGTLFYEDSTNDSSIGKYFGFDDKRKLTVGEGGTNCVDIDRAHFIHDCECNDCDSSNVQCSDCRLQGTFNLSGSRSAYGVELSYYQNLDFIYDGMYFLINAPISREENRLNIRKHTQKVTCSSCACNPCTCGSSCSPSSCATNQKGGSCGSATSACGGCNESSCNSCCADLCEQKQPITKCTAVTAVGICDYFAGNVCQDSPNTQEGLRHAKIDGKTKSQTELGDLDVILGWDFYREADAHVGVNLGVTFPTSSNPGHNYVFEPTAGNGDHWGLGAGATATFTPWSSDDQELEVVFALNYRYLFESEETRTLGVNCQNWAQYMLIGQVGCVGVQPGANVLTRSVDVTPGSEVDALIGLAYTWDNWTFDLGYNLYARESEDVDLNSDSWCDCTYGFAGKNYCTDVNPCFTEQDIADCTHTICKAACSDSVAGPFINRCDLDTSVAETPSFATHKLYGSIGHTMTKWEYPTQFKLGAFYEWASSSRKSPENWSVFGGVAVSF